MDQPTVPAELLRHLCASSRLNEAEARQLVNETLAYFSEPVPDFVRRRHLSLQQCGMGNAQIYQRISTELRARRFPAAELSERQIRRLIYG